MSKRYVITCARRSADDCHVESIGSYRIRKTGKKKRKARTIKRVRQKMKAGDLFFTRVPDHGLQRVGASSCASCGAKTIETIRTGKRDTTGDHLDALPSC